MVEARRLKGCRSFGNQAARTRLFHDKFVGKGVAIPLAEFRPCATIPVAISQNAPALRSAIAAKSSKAIVPSSKHVVPQRRWPMSWVSECDEIWARRFVRRA